jgi:hypothetical protein
MHVDRVLQLPPVLNSTGRPALEFVDAALTGAIAALTEGASLTVLIAFGHASMATSVSLRSR